MLEWTAVTIFMFQVCITTHRPGGNQMTTCGYESVVTMPEFETSDACDRFKLATENLNKPNAGYSVTCHDRESLAKFNQDVKHALKALDALKEKR